jgi:RNA polymerase sigma-70 factor (ECF subfamily)
MSSDSGSPDPAMEHPEIDNTGSGPTPGPRKLARLLVNYQPLIDRLYSEAGEFSWALTRARFEAALERSAAKRFAAGTVAPDKLEEYLGALHLRDLCLAAACADGHADAWDYFVVTYRSYLRSAAVAILRCPAGSPAAHDLADSLFADLYGLTKEKGVERSLFRYFHGRSSLKTWLRAVLAQRHIDAIRSARRFTELDDDTVDRGDPKPSRLPLVPNHAQSPADPHRDRYVALFTRTLQTALGLLDPRDRERLRLYYADELTLAEIGRLLGEHESSVSRNLERVRQELRSEVELALRNGRVAGGGSPAELGLSDEEISLCFEYAAEDAPIDLDKLLPPRGPSPERFGP